MGIRLRGPGIYLPDDVLTNEDLSTLVDTDDEWIMKRVGIKERRISYDKNTAEMGAEAAKNLVKKLRYDPASIEEVIFAVNRHDDAQEFPAHASVVAAALGLDKVPLSDKGAGCTGLVYAIREAYNNMMAERKHAVLVVASERLTDITDYSDRATCVLFGDGAGAYLLERSEHEGIIKNFVGGEPDTSHHLTLQPRGGRKLLGRLEEGFQKDWQEQNYMQMNGGAVLKFAQRVMVEAVMGVLEGTQYKLSDVDVIIPHAANTRIIDPARKALEKEGFTGEMFTNIQQYGNTSSASIPIAAAEARENGALFPGSLAINVAFGAGFTYGANLYWAE